MISSKKNSDNRIILFIKSPVAGKVKTRLQPDLSPVESATLYQSFAQDIVSQLIETFGSQMISVAYQSFPEFPELSWLNSKVELHHFPQNGNDLGEKLIHAFKTVFDDGAKKVIALGTDAPHLPLSIVTQAFESLDNNDVVVGPCEDGGYYLIGLNHMNKKIFENINWSTSNVLPQTQAVCKKEGKKTFLLPIYYDVDVFEDLKRLNSDKKNNLEKAPKTRIFLDHFFRRTLIDRP
ncbi:MAG: TIGR04282 family arsenosugar biosynthesis glycosyltransferase [Elusimicrobiota bacterium]